MKNKIDKKIEFVKEMFQAIIVIGLFGLAAFVIGFALVSGLIIAMNLFGGGW